MATGSVNTVTKSVYVNVQYPVLGFNVNLSSAAGASGQIAYSGGKNHETNFITLPSNPFLI